MENKSATKTLSPSQMETLNALCNTFVPSINEALPETTDESVTNFFQTSGSSTGTPHQVAWLINHRMKHPKLNSLLLMLWFLSTRIGTLLLCGMASLSTQFPFVLRFPEISQKKRERIVQSWACSRLQFIRNFFTAMKALVLLVFFTQVDDKGDNPSWKAIGYCGPDPSIPEKQKNQKHHDHEDDIPVADIQELLYGPLYNGIINLNQPEQHVFNRLTKLGCSVAKPKPPGPSFVIECDAVVVGSGCGGGVIGGVLASAGYKVLVLEKGNYYARTNLSLLEGPSMDKMFLGSGLLMTKDLDMVLLAGSTVGGGSAINWSASIKTPPYVLRDWVELHGLELFGSDVYQKAMDTICRKMGVQREVEDEGFQNMILRKGCEELGYPVVNIPQNAPRDHYCGWCTFGCKDGRKKGTPETWLVDLIKSGNAAILPECEALEVIHERNKAKGVLFAFQRDGVKQTAVIKSKVTVVSCGALTTPSLLINSGLKNKNIGRNLHLHPVVFAWGHFPGAWPEKNKKSYEGAIMTAMSTAVLNVNGTGYGAIIQTPALHPGLFSVLIPWSSGQEFKKRMSRYSRTAHIFALARDKGAGEAFSPTTVTYDLDKTDEENLQRGLEKLLRILAAAGAEEIGCNHGTGRTLKVNEASREEFERFVKEESSQDLRKHPTLKASAHQMGSCRMGVDPKTSVVNPKGETWEVEGLFVGDGSVLPTALGVNPMVTIMSVSYCISQSVLEFLKTHD